MKSPFVLLFGLLIFCLPDAASARWVTQCDGGQCQRVWVNDGPVARVHQNRETARTYRSVTGTGRTYRWRGRWFRSTGVTNGSAGGYGNGNGSHGGSYLPNEAAPASDAPSAPTSANPVKATTVSHNPFCKCGPDCKCGDDCRCGTAPSAPLASREWLDEQRKLRLAAK